MNELTPYEQLIAAKLEQLPVPDMADSIWANIETQLDPSPAPESRPASQKPTGKAFYYLAAIIAVTALLWWFLSHKDRPVVPPSPTPAPTIQPAPVIQPPPPTTSVPSAPRKQTTPTKVKVDTPVVHIPKIDSVRIDTPHIAPHIAPRITPGIPLAVPDFDPYELPPTPPPSPTPAKKRRGVKGITENDYKISTKKDSTNKKN